MFFQRNVSLFEGSSCFLCFILDPLLYLIEQIELLRKELIRLVPLNLACIIPSLNSFDYGRVGDVRCDYDGDDNDDDDGDYDDDVSDDNFGNQDHDHNDEETLSA